MKREAANRQPTVWLVGAGPGDPELLTRKAVRLIRQASVLLVDDLVGAGVLRFAQRSPTNFRACQKILPKKIFKRAFAAPS